MKRMFFTVVLLSVLAAAQAPFKSSTVVEFHRLYTVTLHSRGVPIRLEIECKPFGGRWLCNGELTQPDGRYVFFDPESPADKILDPDLLPSVESACREMLRSDRAWRMSAPDSFVDSKGVSWKRAKGVQ